MVRAWNGENFEKELQRVCEFYKDDLDEQLLVSQLMVFQANKPQTKISTFKEVWEHCKSMSKGQKSLLMQIVIVLKLLLVMPATNAVSERSFSGLRRIKTYLRTTMKQSRLNHLMSLHVHKDITDTLDLISVANEFVSLNSTREYHLGKFSPNDLP